MPMPAAAARPTTSASASYSQSGRPQEATIHCARSSAPRSRRASRQPPATPRQSTQRTTIARGGPMPTMMAGTITTSVEQKPAICSKYQNFLACLSFSASSQQIAGVLDDGELVYVENDVWHNNPRVRQHGCDPGEVDYRKILPLPCVATAFAVAHLQRCDHSPLRPGR